MIRVGKRTCCFALFFCLLFQSLAVPVNGSAKQRTMRLNYTRKTITIGDKFQLKPKAAASSKKKIVWKSSRKKVASVSGKGWVKGKKSGKTKITAQYKGDRKKAVCIVTVKKKKSSGKPADHTDATVTNTASPEGTTTVPSQTAVPQPSGTAIPTPGSTGIPQPVESPQPTVSAVPVDSSVLVVSSNVIEKNGVTMTAYLINKLFYGDITISLNGKNYTDKTSGRNLLMLLATSATGDTPQMNSSGTIRVSRKSLEDEYWTVEDLELSKTYFLKAETKNTLDPSKADCGVVYVQGDVRSEVEIYTNTQ